MKDEIGQKIMTNFAGPRANSYSYLKDKGKGKEDKKAKSTKRWVIKTKLKFENYKNCLGATNFEIKTKYLEKNKINIDSL